MQCIHQGARKLYAFTVLCVVYVLRRNGHKLPIDVAKSRPTPGWLTLGPDPRVFYPRTVARLMASARGDTDLLEVLLHAHVRAIKGGGLLIHGQEAVPIYGAANVPQAWWCLPGTMDDTTVPP